MFSRRPLPRDAWPAGIGPAWRELLEQLDDGLRAVDPRCFICGVEVEGVLLARIYAPADVRTQARALVRETARAPRRLAKRAGTRGAFGPGLW